MEKAKRYLVFLVGLFISSLGVSLITKASLGTSPISAIPYVLSLRFSWTLGEFTIVFSLLLVALQVVILRRRFRLEHLLQIPVSVAFGYFIDLTMLGPWAGSTPRPAASSWWPLRWGAWCWALASTWRCWPTWSCCPESPLCAPL